jgi:hypothetical protein
VAAIARARRPINGNAALGESRELFVQKRQTQRAGRMRIDEIAREHDEIDRLGYCQVEHAGRRSIWRIGQQLDKMVGGLSQPERRLLEMKIRGLEKPKRFSHRKRLPAQSPGAIIRSAAQPNGAAGIPCQANSTGQFSGAGESMPCRMKPNAERQSMVRAQYSATTHV